MKKLSFLIVIIIAFQSCASLLNGNTTQVNINSNKPITVIYKNDTIVSKNNKLVINPIRQKDSLKFSVLHNKIKSDFSYKSKNSFFYWYNVPTNYGLGMLIDRTNDKRYTYKSHYYFEIDSTIQYIKHLKLRNRQGEFALTISLPYLNAFKLNRNANSNINSIGFLGISFGLEYFYSRKAYLSTNISAFTEFPIFVPVPITDNRNAISEVNINITNNHLFGKWSIGYGLGYSSKQYNINDEEENTSEKLNSNTLSLNIPAYYHFSPNFRIGLIYRPSVLDLSSNPSPFGYEHSLSLDLQWSIRLF